MSPDPLRVTDAELAVLQTLWEHGPATTRQLTVRLYPEGTVAQYYTVQKLLERLEEKECVARDRSRRAHLFSARVDRETLVGERLKQLADSVCEGSLVPVLTSLVRLRKFNAAELETLKSLVAELDRRPEREPPNQK